MPPKAAAREERSKDSTAVVTVNIDDFTRTRDSVIVSLATLQSAVSDLSRAYINHANTILNRGPSTLELGGITASLLENGLLGTASAATGAGAGSGLLREGTAEPKKKRKRAHDPNAPKRALTPYFLYLHHQRGPVAKEMAGAKPNEVNEECRRRWREMNESERQHWKDMYAENLAAYQERKKAYQAGLPVPEDDSHVQDAAAQLQSGVDNAAEATSSDESSESEREPTPEPVKQPTPPRSQKRRRTLDVKPAPEPSSTAAKKASPEKRKKKEKEEKAEKVQKAAAVETPKSEKKSRKKRKSHAHADE